MTVKVAMQAKLLSILYTVFHKQTAMAGLKFVLVAHVQDRSYQYADADGLGSRQAAHGCSRQGAKNTLLVAGISSGVATSFTNIQRKSTSRQALLGLEVSLCTSTQACHVRAAADELAVSIHVHLHRLLCHKASH